MPYVFQYKRLGQLHYAKSWDHPIEGNFNSVYTAPVTKIKEISQNDYDTITLEDLVKLWKE